MIILWGQFYPYQDLPNENTPCSQQNGIMVNAFTRHTTSRQTCFYNLFVGFLFM
uniref:Uncharacterized protein n=1 Tax=Rhizophora mucronata TaxID=61149 RepID=A0A2P2PEK8_RHIMU